MYRMPKNNDFKLDVVSVRLVKDAPIYSEHTFNNPADIAAVMGDCMCQFDREVVCVVNLRSDLFMRAGITTMSFSKEMIKME